MSKEFWNIFHKAWGEAKLGTPDCVYYKAYWINVQTHIEAYLRKNPDAAKSLAKKAQTTVKERLGDVLVNKVRESQEKHFEAWLEEHRLRLEASAERMLDYQTLPCPDYFTPRHATALTAFGRKHKLNLEYNPSTQDASFSGSSCIRVSWPYEEE